MTTQRHEFLSLSLLIPLLTLANAPAVRADAVADLSVVDGTACRLAGSVQQVLKNNNTARRVTATIRVGSSNVASYRYITPSGTELMFNYPYQREVWLLPGGTAILGCSVMRVSLQDAAQTFSVTGAYYPAGPSTLPPESAADFVGWLYRPLPTGITCEDEATNHYMMHPYNRHPYRTILVDTYDTLNGEVHDVVVPPQHGTSAFGCSHYNGQWRGWKMSNIRFDTPALTVAFADAAADVTGEPSPAKAEQFYEGVVNGLDVIATPGLPVRALAFINASAEQYIQVETSEQKLQSALESASAQKAKVRVSFIDGDAGKQLTRVQILDR